MSKVSDLIQGKGNSGHELPKKFPDITDWVIYWWGDPTVQASPSIPIQMKVTSGIPQTGQISGIAFFDPGTQLVDAEGKPLQVPPLMPVPMVPYSPEGRKLTWMPIDEFRVMVKREMKAATQEKGEEANVEILPPEPKPKRSHETQVITLGMEGKEGGFHIPPPESR